MPESHLGPLTWVDYGGPRLTGRPSDPSQKGAADPDATPVLVCVHGLGGSHLDWFALAPLLTERYRVLAVDLPAHGRTPPASSPATVPAMTQALATFLEEVVGRRAVLIGNSLGALVAAELGGGHQDLVAGMVLIDPSVTRRWITRVDPEVLRAFLGFAVPPLGRWIQRRRVRRGASSPAPQTIREVVLATLAFCAADAATVPESVVDAYVSLARERLTMEGTQAGFHEATVSVLLRMYRPLALTRTYRAVTCPTLWLHGAKDRLVPLADAQRMARRVHAQPPLVHPDLGHIPQLEDAAWVAEQILTWLDAQPGGYGDWEPRSRRSSPRGTARAAERSGR